MLSVPLNNRHRSLHLPNKLMILAAQHDCHRVAGGDSPPSTIDKVACEILDRTTTDPTAALKRGEQLAGDPAQIGA